MGFNLTNQQKSQLEQSSINYCCQKLDGSPDHAHCEIIGSNIANFIEDIGVEYFKLGTGNKYVIDAGKDFPEFSDDIKNFVNFMRTSRNKRTLDISKLSRIYFKSRKRNSDKMSFFLYGIPGTTEQIIRDNFASFVNLLDPTLIGKLNLFVTDKINLIVNLPQKLQFFIDMKETQVNYTNNTGTNLAENFPDNLVTARSHSNIIIDRNNWCGFYISPKSVGRSLAISLQHLLNPSRGNLTNSLASFLIPIEFPQIIKVPPLDRNRGIKAAETFLVLKHLVLNPAVNYKQTENTFSAETLIINEPTIVNEVNVKSQFQHIARIIQIISALQNDSLVKNIDFNTYKETIQYIFEQRSEYEEEQEGSIISFATTILENDCDEMVTKIGTWLDKLTTQLDIGLPDLIIHGRLILVGKDDPNRNSERNQEIRRFYEYLLTRINNLAPTKGLTGFPWLTGMIKSEAIDNRYCFIAFSVNHKTFFDKFKKKMNLKVLNEVKERLTRNIELTRGVYAFKKKILGIDNVPEELKIEEEEKKKIKA